MLIQQFSWYNQAAYYDYCFLKKKTTTTTLHTQNKSNFVLSMTLCARSQHTFSSKLYLSTSLSLIHENHITALPNKWEKFVLACCTAQICRRIREEKKEKNTRRNDTKKCVRFETLYWVFGFGSSCGKKWLKLTGKKNGTTATNQIRRKFPFILAISAISALFFVSRCFPIKKNKTKKLHFVGRPPT